MSSIDRSSTKSPVGRSTKNAQPGQAKKKSPARSPHRSPRPGQQSPGRGKANPFKDLPMKSITYSNGANYEGQVN